MTIEPRAGSASAAQLLCSPAQGRCTASPPLLSRPCLGPSCLPLLPWPHPSSPDSPLQPCPLPLPSRAAPRYHLPPGSFAPLARQVRAFGAQAVSCFRLHTPPEALATSPALPRASGAGRALGRGARGPSWPLHCSLLLSQILFLPFLNIPDKQPGTGGHSVAFDLVVRREQRAREEENTGRGRGQELGQGPLPSLGSGGDVAGLTLHLHP